MNRIHTACWCLIASAIVLSAMLVTRLSDNVRNDAEASLVISRDTYSLMTAKTRGDEESLFILDNSSGMLLVYNLNVQRGRMELANGLQLNEYFDRVSRGGGGGGDERRGR